MKSLIKQRKKISFDCRVQIRRYELKKQKDRKNVERERERETDRQTGRQPDRQTGREIETERENKLSNKEEENTE